MTAGHGSPSNLPFSIENILREDFGPRRTQPTPIPRYYFTGYYGTTLPYYYRYFPIGLYNRWPWVLQFNRPIAGAEGHVTAASNQEHLYKIDENSEKKVETDEHRSDLDNSDSDLEEISSAKTCTKGKRKHEDVEETTESSTSLEEPKKKRLRSQFTEMQLNYLEKYFSNSSYLSRDERNVLAQALDMTELQIRNWFQNRRYQKKHKVSTTSDSTAATAASSVKDSAETSTGTR